MIDRTHALPVTRQARELGISRGSIYYLPRPTSVADLAIMRRLDELHMDFPFAGSRMLRDLLAADGVKVGRLHVSTLMKKMAIRGGSVCLNSPARLLSGASAGFMPLREAVG